MNNVLAIVPARGGSKGIPRKNLALVNGIPLVGHSIAHALGTASITRTIVSTDDPEIASVARSLGAEVPFLRPEELAADHVLDHPVFQHVLETLDRTEGYVPELVVHLRPTTPFRRIEWIEAAIASLRQHPEADSLRSVSLAVQHPYRMFTIRGDGFLQPLMRHEHEQPYVLRRQDLPPIYYYNCVLDITRPRTVLDQESMTGKSILPFVVPEDEVFDVDGPRDLAVARFLMESMQ